MSNALKALMVLGTAFFMAACAQEAPVEEAPMVMEEPSMGKM